MTTVRRTHDEAPDFSFPGQHGSYAAPAFMSDAIPYRASMPPARSRFEGLAVLARALPSTAADLLGVLLASTFPTGGGGCDVLRPLWAEEAMHRAYGFVRLIDARKGRRELTRSNPMIEGLDCVIARDLAARFRELEVDEERKARPCASVLHDIAAGLGALFGRPAGVIVATEIEAMLLPSYKRRALVLAAGELVGNSLLHAFHGRRTGLIEVSLTVHGTESASLRVADDGIGFTDMRPNLDCGVAASLAGLLEADLAYDRKDGRTIAEIAFPLSGS
jgi:hypothetical protein